tara:strand:+ start:188 stop:484 length:297 start_codon:yes stop_codon:yes gene_type:complete
MSDSKELWAVAKASVMSKHLRGRYINVNRMVRDMDAIDDASASNETKDATMSKLAGLVAKAIKSDASDDSADAPAPKTDNSIVEALNKINDRLDKLEK